MNVIRVLNVWVQRSEPIWFGVLVAIALVAPWTGVEAPMTGAVGEGFVWLDAGVTALVWAAFSAQVARIVVANGTEHITVRIASWLLLLSLGMLCGRLGWLLATVGDVRMTLSMALALICLASSVILHAVGRVVYTDRHRADDGDEEKTP